MSKRLKEIFAKIRYVSFLETIEDSPCQEMGSLDILVEEQLADGRAWMHEASRYVKFYHSEDKFTQYEIRIDKTCGIGRLHFDDIFEYPYMIEEVEDATQEEHPYTIQYFVNGTATKDVAKCLQDPTMHYEIRIVNQQIAQATVELYASLRDRQQEACRFQEGEEFNVFISNDRFEKNVVLHAGNGFREILHNIPIATYSIEEHSNDYVIRYRFQCGEEKKEGVGMLCAGNNEIEIIHEICKKATIIIERYVRANGQLCKPTTKQEYRVRVISDDMDCVVSLCEENAYCVCLENVRPGYYDICEIDGYDKVSYSVNGQYEANFASVLVHKGKDANVMIIQDPSQTICHAYQDSPLRICKYIRRFDGSITKPQADAQFMVSLRGCGICETFYLNVHNNFCVDIADLCYGEYEVCEVTCGEYTTSYIVNDGREKTTAYICINNTDSYCVSIINEQRNKGCVSIQQYIRNEYGELVKPQRNESFQVCLSSYFFKKCFTLASSNDWSVCVHDLRFGSYEIREENQEEYDITYQNDGERPTNRARFVIDDGREHEVKIINHQKKEESGVLKICNFEETNAHELVKPACDEEFEVVVQGEGFHEKYCLCANNNWCVMLEGLSKGEYEVWEVETYHYDVRYQVNCECVDQVLLCMGEDNQEVSIINKRKSSGILKLYGSIRTNDGRLLRPKRSECFEILVEGSQDSFSVCLNEQNDWCVLLDSLREEVYRIIQKDNQGYRVSYCIEGEEVSFAKVKLGRNDVEVGIINQEKGCTGLVHVTQYIEDEEGNMSLPAVGEEYRFIIDGRCFSRTYTLRESNNFCVCFDDLDEGNYAIKAIDSTDPIRYCVNGNDVDKASFQLMDEDICVDMIHTCLPRGEVCIKKCIRRNHTLELPDVDSTYRILLKGKNTHEIYQLHAGNEFCICLSGLDNQHYEVIELDALKPSFELNGNVQEEGYFLYDGERIQLTIINEEVLYGNMEIVKKIEDEQGNLMHPNRCETFEVRIESEEYQKCVTLNHDNDFCVRLYDLAQGHYEIKELHTCGNTSYLINGLPASRAVVDVSDFDTCITIINHSTTKGCIQFSASVRMDGNVSVPDMEDEVKLCMASEDMHKEVCLHKGNAFCEQVVDLAPGSYTITGEKGEDIHFEIDDQVFEDDVCVDLHGEFVCVHVIRCLQSKANITICARMQDANGTLREPNQEDTFATILLHNGCKQMFELNCEHSWTRQFCNQNKGEYEVKVEEKGFDVRYEWQGEAQADGRFILDKEDVKGMAILTKKCKRQIHVESIVEDGNGNRLSCQQDMKFKMCIQGANNKEECILQCSNHWSACMEVESGSYTIYQQDDPMFQDLYYLVDGHKEGKIEIDIEKQDVVIQAVNVRTCHTGSIQIATYKRAQNCDCYRKPNETDAYDVEITSSNYHEIIPLNENNHWKAKLEMLASGTYTIKERQATDTTRYICNGGQEEKVANVQVCEEENSVTIINEEEVPYKGSIELCKLLKDEEGCYRYPKDHERFWIMIKGESSSNRILLNSANHFYASMRNLPQGWYEVSEESDTQGLMYVVNNAAPVPRGFVQVKQNANTVNIIQTCKKDSGSMTIRKYIQGENGECTKPMDGTYQIHVSKSCFNKTIELNKENAYSLVLKYLEDGTYVVDELAQEGAYYRIDKGTCVDRAIVNVVQDDHQIDVINTQIAPQKGSIALVSYIRIKERLLRPNEEDTFVYHLESENLHKFYTLDKTNQFMYTINNVDDGEYRLSETTTGDASYIINGQAETTVGIIHVHANQNTVQIMHSKGKQKGSMLLQKRMRVNQEYVQPPQAFRATIQITKEGFHKVVQLDACNEWTYCLKHLAYGDYLVKELDSMYPVSYIVNGSPSEQAIVSVGEQANVVEIINEQKSDKGSICIEKFIRVENQLVRPQDDFLARVHISKPGYNQVYELNKQNNWKLCINDLENGYYVLDEVDNDDYVSYIINGESEVVHGIVFVNANENTVHMINALRSQSGSIIVSKQLRNDQGAQMEPLPEQTFDIMIRRGSYETKIELNHENNWIKQVTGLMNGSYQVEELTTMYRVSYKVDDGVEELFAPSVNVQGEEHRVQVINAPLTNMGRLEITKFIKRSNGTLIRPADGDVFRISIIGNKKERVVELNAGNMFRMVIHDLEVGEYEIKESYANENYFATYRVNGGEEADIAVVHMDRGIHNQVMVINELFENLNSVDVFKYMLDEDGNYFSPPADLRVQFRMIGATMDEIYDLNVANSWHKSFKSLPNGEYQVIEIGSSYTVQYIVNYGNPQEEARFLAQPGVSNIIGIINLQSNVQQGKLTLIKQMRNHAGDVIMPDVESFVFRVTSAQFDRFVNVNKEDAYTQVLENLPFGTYTVVEQDGNDQVSFRVNGQSETEQGIVEIQDGADNEMIIINTQTETVLDVNDNNKIKVVIE